MKLFFALCLSCSILLLGLWSTWASLEAQAMTSTHYSIPWDSVNTGGNEMGTSTSYSLYDTIGQPVSGSGTSTSYTLEAGYRGGSDPFSLSFIAYGQSVSTRYQTFDIRSPGYVVVSSTVGFAVGDYIVAVQDRGYAALAAIGKITGMSGDILTVDEWDGDAALMDFTSTGNNDYVYKLDSASIPFGTITPGSELSALAGGSIYSSASSGHTVYIQASGPLASATGTIADVTDETVSSDAEEYGAEAIGLHAVSAGKDLGVTTTQRAIVSSLVPATSSPDRFLLLFKLGVTGATGLGDYSQMVYFTLTSNF